MATKTSGVRIVASLGVVLVLYGIIQFLADLDIKRMRERIGCVAMVSGRAVAPGELAEALRAKLWRMGLTWSTLPPDKQNDLRTNVLEDLINSRLVSRTLSANGALPSHQKNGAFQQFLKQFEGDEWKQRAEWQGLNEVSLRQQIGEETAASEAVEQELSKRAPKVTDEMVRRWYDAHRDKLVNPERVHASHIFLTRHDKANPDRAAEIVEIRRKLLAHEATFEELAAQHSDDERSKRVGGDLGWFSRGRVPQDFGDKVFALPVGQISEVFETRLGWHIALVKEKRPAEPLTFEQAKPEVAALLMDERRRNALGALLTELRQKANIERFEDRIAKVEPAP